jgi:hypothetical protein
LNADQHGELGGKSGGSTIQFKVIAGDGLSDAEQQTANA